jgi:hypothetical protein
MASPWDLHSDNLLAQKHPTRWDVNTSQVGASGVPSVPPVLHILWRSMGDRDTWDGWDTWLQGVGCRSHPDPLVRTSSCRERGSHLPLVMRTSIAVSGRPSPYCCRDRGSTNRQRHPVVDEGEIMLENIFSDVGIQEVLASNQGIDGTE